MVWDGLMVLMVLTLGVAGWNVGIVNSWRGPFAIVIATLVTQQFYVDFAAFVAQQLRLAPSFDISIAYMLMWCAVEMTVEVLMMIALQFNRKVKPLFFERLFGAVFGLIKGMIILVLPAIALSGPINIPIPPADKSSLINPMESGVDASNLLPWLQSVGKGLYPGFGGLVASQKKPSFKLDWGSDTPAN